MRSIVRIFLFISVLLTCCHCPTMLAQEKKEKKGKIEQFEKELEKSDDDSSKHRGKNNHSDEDDSSFFGSLVGELIMNPTFLFNLFIGSTDDEDSFLGINFWNSYFSDYPYQTPGIGLYSSPDATDKRFSMKLFGNYFYNSADLHGFDFRARICPLPFLGVALDFTHLTEELDTQVDQIQIYNIFLNYNRVRSECLALWWGLGMKGILRDQARHGFAVNIGTEIYPIQPISLHCNYNVGSINSQAVGELLLHLNFHVQRSIVFIGYHHYSVGSAVLEGAIAGIGFYL